MKFILGIIVGLLISFIILVSEVFLKSRGGFLTERIIKKVENKTKQKGAIIMPDSPMEEIIKKSNEKGEDVKLEEL